MATDSEFAIVFILYMRNSLVCVCCEKLRASTIARALWPHSAQILGSIPDQSVRGLTGGIMGNPHMISQRQTQSSWNVSMCITCSGTYSVSSILLLHVSYHTLLNSPCTSSCLTTPTPPYYTCPNPHPRSWMIENALPPLKSCSIISVAQCGPPLDFLND
jgi:hypothetical protein